MLEELVQKNPNPVLILDPSNVVAAANAAAENLFGQGSLTGRPFKAEPGQASVQLGIRKLDITELTIPWNGQSMRLLFFKEDLEVLRERFAELEVTLKTCRQENGRLRRANEIADQQNRAAFARLRESESRVQELEQQLHRAVEEALRVEPQPSKGYEDPVTGLPGVGILNEFLELALNDVEGTDRALAVMLLDIDRFQSVNDLLGQDAGDALLREVAKRLKPLLADKDVLIHRGADEFVAVLQAKPDSFSDAQEVVRQRVEEFHRRMTNALDHSILVGTQSVHVTMSIGAVIFQDGQNRNHLIGEALGALHAAKERGRGDLYFFTPELRSQMDNERALVGQLRQGIDREEFVLHYQPIVDLETGALAGAEALLRWNHPAQGLLSPAHFLRAAETSNLIAPIGDWVIRQACAQSAQMPELFFSINLSPQQLLHSRFVEQFFFALERVQASPECLVVELPEGMGTTRNERVREVLQVLADRGVHLGIDDFGSGSSRLIDLLTLSIRFLKVDRVFVDRIPLEDQSSHIAESIVALSKSLRTACLAEGLETYVQVQALRRLGCKLGQGHYFSKAVRAEELEKLRGHVWTT